MVENVRAEEQAEPPTEESARVLAELNTARQEFMAAMKDFNGLLSSRVLVENKSVKDKEQEQEITSRLVNTTKRIEDLTGHSNDAIIGLCVFAVRQALSLRDAGNKMAYELRLVKKELELIKQDIYEAEEDVAD